VLRRGTLEAHDALGAEKAIRQASGFHHPEFGLEFVPIPVEGREHAKKPLLVERHHRADPSAEMILKPQPEHPIGLPGAGPGAISLCRKQQPHRLHRAGGGDDFVGFQMRGAAIGGLDDDPGDAAARGLEADGGVPREKQEPGIGMDVVGVEDGHT
jgi:hypothetical protein